MSRSLFIKAYSEDIEMKKVLKAEMWDKMQYLFRNYYDRMMHCALFYNGTIDADVLTRVLHFQLDNVPVLHSRYHNNPVKPYWVVQDYKTDDFLTVRASDDLDRDIMAFVTQRIPITDNVQIKVGLFTKDGKSAIAFVVNHMCFDGGDLKYFVTKLCENYTKLLAGDENLEIKHGTRSYDAVYSAMSEEDKKTAKSLYRNISAVKDEHFFPLTEKREGDVNRIVRRKLSAERFNAARLAGKAMGFTVNDIILAAYVRSLYEFGVCKDDERLTIPCMVDLRRHLAKGGQETGLTNHTGFMPVTIDGNGKDMRDMLDKVAKAMEKNKHVAPCLRRFPALHKRAGDKTRLRQSAHRNEQYRQHQTLRLQNGRRRSRGRVLYGRGKRQTLYAARADDLRGRGDVHNRHYGQRGGRENRQRVFRYSARQY